MITGMESRGFAPTTRAERYLKQLCSHFEHKLPVRYDQHSGCITVTESARCELSAVPEGLKLRAFAAEATELAMVEGMIARHLEHFGTRDAISIAWERPS